MPPNSYPYLMTLHGKHGDHYFHVNSRQDFIDTCRKMFDINKANNFYIFHTDEDYEVRINSLKEQISKMEDPAFTELADKTKLKSYKSNLQYYMYDREDAKLYNRALIDDAAMVNFVWSRRNFEYETISTDTYS